MLTDLQSKIAHVLAKNRTATSYFAGGSVLNENAFRVSDDLDIFSDRDDQIPDIVKRDIAALRKAGFAVSIDLEIYGCTDATIGHDGETTQVQWMSESRMRFFPLQADPAWGLRLHMTDLAINKVLAASTRRASRDAADLVIIAENYCGLGPLFLGAALKLGSLSPLRLLDDARHRLASAPNDEIASLRGLPEGWTAASIKEKGLQHLDAAQDFLEAMPEDCLSGIPVDTAGVPVADGAEPFEIRELRDGGGQFPAFPDSTFDP